jgi:DMSO/TMAO reductase YedYZ molybdopterin-dependent catalytic subunit
MRTGANRREFLRSAGAAVAGTMLWNGVWPASTALAAEARIAGKDPRLIEHAAAPAVYETPAALLSDAQVTPVPLLFIRNNSQPSDASTIKPLPLAGWKIELAGLIEGQRTIDAAMLERLEQVEREMVLQCSGNSRSLFAAAAPVEGTNWGRGGMGNVRFKGVPLATLLEKLGITVKPGARYLSAEGKDEPTAKKSAGGETKPSERDDFEHSLPLDEALAKSMLALSLNGAPLPAIHGGPVRLVTPGYYGTMHVKWVERLRFDSGESDHASQMPRYRMPLVPIKPGSKFEFSFANSEPHWRMKIKCVVLDPAPGARLAAGEVTVRGVAFNDGEARIDTVLVSPDAGVTWQRAELIVPESRYAWYRWQARLRLPRGKQQIWAQAIDALGRGQPADGAIHWNPEGYTWNGVEKIDVEAAGS